MFALANKLRLCLSVRLWAAMFSFRHIVGNGRTTSRFRSLDHAEYLLGCVLWWHSVAVAGEAVDELLLAYLSRFVQVLPVPL